MRLICTCIALFTLACQTPASDAGKAPAKAATPAPAAPPKDMPKITGNPGGPGDPHAAPTTRAHPHAVAAA